MRSRDETECPWLRLQPCRSSRLFRTCQTRMGFAPLRQERALPRQERASPTALRHLRPCQRLLSKCLARHHYCPDDPRQLMGGRHGHEPRGLSFSPSLEPIAQCTLAFVDDAKKRCGPENEQAPYIGVALFGDGAEFFFPPAEFCRGVRPSQAEKSRPDLNTRGSGRLAMTAVAASLPTPGIPVSSELVSLCSWA